MDTAELKEVIGKMCRLSVEQGRYEEEMESLGKSPMITPERSKEMMALWRKLDAIIEEGLY